MRAKTFIQRELVTSWIGENVGCSRDVISYTIYIMEFLLLSPYRGIMEFLLLRTRTIYVEVVINYINLFSLIPACIW